MFSVQQKRLRETRKHTEQQYLVVRCDRKASTCTESYQQRRKHQGQSSKVCERDTGDALTRADLVNSDFEASSGSR